MHPSHQQGLEYIDYIPFKALNQSSILGMNLNKI